jgi:hypothetical protein
MKQAFFLLVMIVFYSCSKNEVVLDDNNVPPPDTTINSAVYEDYINRCYILLNGREPDSLELSISLSRLKQNYLSKNAREVFLDSLFSNQEYLDRLYNLNRITILNDLDSNDITFQISLFNIYLQDITYQFAWPSLQYEVNRLDTLRKKTNEFLGRKASNKDLQLAMLNNYFFDQINMGAANYVIAAFQLFLNRNPTVQEQNSGVAMINGTSSVLFLEVGSSKDDFNRILFNSANYAEGITVANYMNFLFRNPTSVEMSNATQKFLTTQSYQLLQRDILITDEFVGLK